jgi:hypothetical protein
MRVVVLEPKEEVGEVSHVAFVLFESWFRPAPGLAKRGGNLPPGLEKHLERNGTLPPGLQKRIEPCPEELDRQLPSLPAEYQRAVIGAHFVIFNRNTKVIVDVMKDVVR